VTNWAAVKQETPVFKTDEDELDIPREMLIPLRIGETMRADLGKKVWFAKGMNR
jgi:hypothetical protein